jgi:hypothetical protein
MTAAGDTALDRLQAVLPAAYGLVGGEAVLDEVEGPARFEDAAELAQGGDRVRDGAQGPGGQRAVEGVVLEGQGLTVETGAAYRELGRDHAVRGEPPGDLGRLDRGHRCHGRGVVGKVVTRSEPDLDNLAVQPFAGAPPERIDHPGTAGEVDEPGYYAIGVEAHLRMLLSP